MTKDPWYALHCWFPGCLLVGTAGPRKAFVCVSVCLAAVYQLSKYPAKPYLKAKKLGNAKQLGKAKN